MASVLIYLLIDNILVSRGFQYISRYQTIKLIETQEIIHIIARHNISDASCNPDGNEKEKQRMKKRKGESQTKSSPPHEPSLLNNSINSTLIFQATTCISHPKSQSVCKEPFLSRLQIFPQGTGSSRNTVISTSLCPGRGGLCQHDHLAPKQSYTHRPFPKHSLDEGKKES